MDSDRCMNNNHSRSNVPVRFCPDCGEVVGKSVAVKTCSSETHARRRKDRNKYCVDCGGTLAGTTR